MNEDSKIAIAAERSELVITIYKWKGQKVTTFTVMRNFIQTDSSEINFVTPATMSIYARRTPGMQQHTLKIASPREDNPSRKLPNLFKNSFTISISLCQEDKLQVNETSTGLRYRSNSIITKRTDMAPQNQIVLSTTTKYY